MIVMQTYSEKTLLVCLALIICSAGYESCTVMGKNGKPGSSECDPNPCGNGTCVVSGSSFHCNCFSGYVQIKSNGRYICTKDLCLKNPCGVGVCITKNIYGDYVCKCPEDYVLDDDSGAPETCTLRTKYFEDSSRGLLPSINLLPPTRSLQNKYFRHASVGYTAAPGQKPAWNVVTTVNWLLTGAVQGVKNQMGCKSCAVFATTSAIESMIYLSNPPVIASVPSISSQQFLDCGAGSCNGSWVGDTLEYASRQKLLPQSLYPYTGIAKPAMCTANKLLQGQYSTSMYEQVSFYGWFGLILALQQQPVIVSVEGSSTAFLSYTAGIFSDPSCYTNGLDHSILLVGYNLTSTPPYWLLMNSWGPKWGESGTMRLAITDREGVCGINVLPGYYPITANPTGKDPCFSESFGGRLRSNLGGLNPCGGGRCQEDKNSIGGYKCRCVPPFVSALNLDNTTTCAPANPCSFFSRNPCGVGTCVNSQTPPGDYTCLCPIGYAQERLAVDNKPTCVPAATFHGSLTFKVPKNYNFSCPTLYTLFGISRKLFVSQNPKVNCNIPRIPAGTVLNVTNNLGNCSLPYAVNEGDNCTSIAKLFQPRLRTKIYGPGSPNPDLDCNSLQPGQLVCIERQNVLRDFSLCTQPYTLKATDTCQSLIRSKFAGDAYAFYQNNPGIYCKRLMPPVAGSLKLSIEEVCLKSEPFGSMIQGCIGRRYKVNSGDTCFRLIATKFKTWRTFRKFNKAPCREKILIVGRSLCTP